MQFCREIIRDPSLFDENGIFFNDFNEQGYKFDVISSSNYWNFVKALKNICSFAVLEAVEERVPLLMEMSTVNIFNSVKKFLPTSIVDVNKKQLLERMRSVLLSYYTT